MPLGVAHTCVKAGRCGGSRAGSGGCEWDGEAKDGSAAKLAAHAKGNVELAAEGVNAF